MLGSIPSLRAEVAFDFIAETSLIVVPVMINGHGPYRFLLDTGATHTVLSETIADTLKIPQRRRGTLVTAGGSIDVTVRALRTLKIGTAQLDNIEIAVGNLERIKTLRVDGLLGGDFLRRFLLVIDYDGKVLNIKPST
jgi:predicted aspartyl protease